MIKDPDVELMMIDHLAATLPNYGIFAPVSDRPGQVDRDDEAVVLYRTGGVRRDLVTDEAQISIDVRAGNNTRAAEIISTVRAVVNDMWCRLIGGHQVYSVRELSGPYVNPTDADPYRYSQNFLVAVRAFEIA